MKNSTMNLTGKSSAPFTFAISLHQNRSALTPRGKQASFIFVGLNYCSEQGILMVAKSCMDEEEG
jgi:hypothetical protein